MFALLLPLLAGIPGLIGKYFEQKNAIESAKLEAQRQIEVARQQLAGEIAKGQMDLNKAIVASTGAGFKYFTFFMWFGPFMIGTVFPKYSHDIFQNLQGMPEWYVQSCMLIMFTVWGISVSAPVVSNIFNGLGNFFAARRDYKLELKKVDRKAYYDALRLSKGYVDQTDIAEMEPVFNKLDKDNEANG